MHFVRIFSSQEYNESGKRIFPAALESFQFNSQICITIPCLSGVYYGILEMISSIFFIRFIVDTQRYDALLHSTI